MTFRRFALAGAALTLLALLPVGCGDDVRSDFGPVSGERALATTREICDLGPRPPGSDNLRKTADLIERKLKEIDPSLQLNRQTFKSPDLKNTAWADVEFQNLWCQIPGKDPENGPIIALCAHYDSKVTHPGEQDFEFIGALDAAASCATLIEIARQVHQEKSLTANVWLIWFDGEESLPWDWDDEQALVGSTWFANNIAKEQGFPRDRLTTRMQALILLDLLGHEQLKIDRPTESNPKLIEMLAATAAEMEMADVMFRYEIPMTDDHIPFKKLGVKVLDVFDFRGRSLKEHEPEFVSDDIAEIDPWWHTEMDTCDKVSARSLDFVGNLVHQMLPKVDAEFCQR